MDRTDVLIIGGGLVGCATALHLARAGVATIVAESGDVNAVASGQNAGSLHFQLERRFLEQGDALMAQAARVIALNRAAIAEWHGLEAMLDRSVGVAMRGGLMVAETSEQVALLEKKARLEEDAGMATRLVDATETRTIAPYLGDRVLAALWAPDEGHADPKQVTPAFAAAARDAGAEIASHSPVAAIEKCGGGFVARIATAHGERQIRCDRIVIAAGAWIAVIGTMLNLHLPMFSLGLTMNVSERTDPFIPHLVQHVGRRLSMKQAGAGNVLIGGGWPSKLHLAAGGTGFDLRRRPDPIPASIAGNLEAAVAVVPRVAGLNLIRTWTGTVAVSSDQLPIVGQVPRTPGVYVAGGGSAFTLGPTFARLLSQEIVSGNSAPDLADFSPARFEHLNSFMG
jgi:glycine/D-amino acid oxidase-like deaminating enzyme